MNAYNFVRIKQNFTFFLFNAEKKSLSSTRFRFCF